MNRIIKLSSLLFVVSSLGGCANKPVREDIHILCTTDVHCAIDENIGYSSFVAYANNLKKDNKYVSLVDSGDFIQGDFVGAISKGEYIVEIVNKVGYEAMTMGNHEFDYGMDQLQSVINKLNPDVLSCNVRYTGKKTNKLSKVKPYKIVKYGPIKVGYVGVTTPFSIGDATPSTFMEDGEFVYNFSNQTKETYYSTIQTNIDEVKSKGADYVILLSHCGYGDEYGFSGSGEIIKNTTGLTAVFDGHSHKDISWTSFKDKDNKDVLFVDSGTKLSEFSQLTIKTDGTFETKFITECKEKDPDMEACIADIKTRFEELSKKVVATSDIELGINDSDGVRLVRTRETTIGNLCADAYRYITNADIAVVNGGGIRAKLPAGNITYADIKSVHPYGNELRLVNATGQQILDYLEFTSRDTTADYKEQGTDGNYMAKGENGAFAQVSGLKYTIDTSIPASIQIDENNMFVAVTGPRRVKNVQVENNGTWTNIDVNKTYKFSSHNFLIDGGGDGANMFMNCEHLDCTKKADYEVLIDYIIDGCKGNLSKKYSNTEGRITVQ